MGFQALLINVGIILILFIFIGVIKRGYTVALHVK